MACALPPDCRYTTGTKISWLPCSSTCQLVVCPDTRAALFVHFAGSIKWVVRVCIFCMRICIGTAFRTSNRPRIRVGSLWCHTSRPDGGAGLETAVAAVFRVCRTPSLLSCAQVQTSKHIHTTADKQTTITLLLAPSLLPTRTQAHTPTNKHASKRASPARVVSSRNGLVAGRQYEQQPPVR